MPAMQRRPRFVPTLLLLAPALWILRELSSLGFAVHGGQPSLATSRSTEVRSVRSGLSPKSSTDVRATRVTRFAEDSDSIEVSGYSSFLVGLALLPYVLFTLYSAFGIGFRGEAFGPGPYGIEYVACAVNFGLVLWSLGSFLQRGRGLPAGPFGLFGLAEGLSYLASLLLLGSVVVSGVRTAGSSSGNQLQLPTPADIKLPEFKAPEFKAPDFKVPEFKAPDFKTPEFKAPDFKAPDFKTPDFKAPDIKIPDAPKLEAPSFKLPEISLPKPLPKPEKKAAEPKKVEPKEEEEAPPPKKEEPVPLAKKLADKLPDFEDLFD